jgi:ATP-binding cassette, subfamily C (CFTR/MRP), member 1
MLVQHDRQHMLTHLILDSFAALTQIALITAGSYYMAITIPLILIVMYCLQHYYLQVSRQLRLLELESRSPVYSHFLETLEGLETIKAFHWQMQMTNIHYIRLDRSQQPYYLMFCIERWLALVLDLIVAGIATAVVALALSLRHSTNPGLLGVSMNAVLCKAPSSFKVIRVLTCVCSFQSEDCTVYGRMDCTRNIPWSNCKAAPSANDRQAGAGA